jgi:hypothetical protein
MKYPYCSGLLCVLLGIILACSILSCSKSEEQEQGKLSIVIHDAAGNMKELKLIVSRVSIHRAGSPPDIGWSTITPLIEGTFDVLDLRNGRKLPLVLNDAPKGNYDGIKIYFGACSVVLEDGEHYIQPYGQGYGLNFDFEVLEGTTCQLSLDMDANGSVTNNAGTYYLTPSIHVRNVALCGWLAGSILDDASMPVFARISTVSGGDTVTTLNDTVEGGSFQLLDLSAGVYAVSITSYDPDWLDTVIYYVPVTAGQVYPMGAIHLRPN